MKVLIAGGGTAGHINPGIAIAKYIKQKNPDADIVFVGTQKGLETKLVPREGFELRLITVRGFRRKLSSDTFLAVKELFQGIFEARRIIKGYKPDIVIGTGGYVCGPVVFNASRMKIPTLIHEQNAYPGVTNRILSRFADAVAISFKESKEFFKKAKMLVLTGNPVRSEMLEADRIKARKKLDIALEQPTVVIMGGSRGAEKINESVVEMAVKYLGDEDYKIIFATGEAQYEKIKAKMGDKIPKSIELVPYIYDMANVMAAADLVICRAGAITTSELTVMGIPSILVPSPYVTANHQEHNARALEEQGASVVILEKDLNGNILYNQMISLLKDKEQLAKMSRNSKKTGISNATEKIYSMLSEIIKKKI
ncbi:MAG: undecaprenyldiphospho-muramoylpentapeptide beta-N-acetylglucosaminyltransferase [Clostridia bacterium]|nr:undecaprenyldiphospho-muramoylpentapeptide beta-N-acetylglucosaminyltransferase [Clostridia bacterium]